MANIAQLLENFQAGVVGDPIDETTTIYENISGTATANVFSAAVPPLHTGKSQRIVCGGGNSINRVVFPGVSTLYFSTYIFIESTFTSNTAIINWYSAGVKVGDLQITPTDNLRLRDNNSERWVSAPLARGEWHRVDIMCNPGESNGHRVNVWSGTNRNRTATPSQASPAVSATQAGVLSSGLVDEMRIGAISNDATGIIVFSRHRGDNAVFPEPIAEAAPPNTPPTANAGVDKEVEPYDVVVLNGSGSDSDGTIAEYDWSQLTGPQVDLVGSGASVQFVAPPTMNGVVMNFQLTVRDNAGALATDTVSVTVGRHSSWVVAPDGVTRLPRYQSRVI